MAVMLSACTVEIVDPPGQLVNAELWTDDPVPTLSARLTEGYTHDFSATLDGNPITALFSPAAAPNTVVTAQMRRCFDGGKPYYSSVPVRFMHELIARGEATDPYYIFRSDTLQFVPPSLTFQPWYSIKLILGQTMTVQMSLVPGPGAPVPVSLEPNHRTVSVNGQPAGSPAPATLPANTVGTFTITGVSPGSFVVVANANGVQCGGISGYVARY